MEAPSQIAGALQVMCLTVRIHRGTCRLRSGPPHISTDTHGHDRTKDQRGPSQPWAAGIRGGDASEALARSQQL